MKSKSQQKRVKAQKSKTIILSISISNENLSEIIRAAEHMLGDVISEDYYEATVVGMALAHARQIQEAD